MATNRLDILRGMLEQDPHNSFARYGLAMELGKSDHLQEAVAEYETLLSRDGNYVAAYFHCGQTLEKMSRVEAAREVYSRGMVACSRTGDSHTRSEIESALALLPI